MAKDYYKTLGVDKTASEADIKKAFRKLAHEHHPDKANGNADKFKEINEAYQVLSNKEKRQQYDQFGHAFDGASGGNPFGYGNPFGQGNMSGFDFSGQNMDFDLGDLFGQFFGGGAPGGRSRSQKGSDIQVDVEISLKEAVFGKTEVFSLRKQVACQPCHGTGADKGTAYEKCRTCGGSGKIATTVLGTFRTQTICPECQGKGKSIKEKCRACSGNGFNEEQTDIRVEIPAGIDDGQAVRLSGQGHAGKNGASAGDLYVTVHVKEEPGFVRQDNDLISEYNIPFTMATLGGEMEVKTIDGRVKLKIPAGTPSGKQFVLRDKGVTNLRGRSRGDQIVIVNVEVPKKLSKKQRELLEQLDREFDNKKKSWL